MIRDVSKQYAAFFTEAAEEDKKYSDACKEACKEAEELKQQEIDEFDEEEIDPNECGFSEEEIQVDEVVDPMQMWKDMKKDDKKPALVKVDNNYINTMKKLLSGIKTSKKAVYDRVCGPDGKLHQYMKSNTMLPPPEDFAENFISFDEIARMMSKGKDAETSDAEDLGQEDMSIDSRSAKEYGDTNNAFGNDVADQNLWDSELSEAEEEDAQEKAKEFLDKSKSDISDVDEKSAAEFLKKNDAKIKQVLGKIKDEKTKDNIKKLMKVVDSYSKGKLDDSMISEAAGGKKNKNHVVQFIKATIRMLTWLLMIVPAGLLASAWVIKGVAKISDGLIKKVDTKLAESLTLEVCDDEEAELNEDDEELDETGCNAKKDDSEEIEEADYREHASHLLDPIGVKASTASLAGQDTAAFSVVEKLLNKIDRLEHKIDILESRAEKNSNDAATSKSVSEADESFEDLDDEEVKVTKSDIESSKRKFRSDLDKLSKKQVEEVFDKIANRIQDSLDRQKAANPDPSVKHTPKEVNDAVKKINFFRKLSYERELTPEQKKQFADLVYKYWYDWIYVEKKDEDGETYLDPVASVKDMLNQPFKSFFGRPGNHVALNSELIYDNGNVYTIAPFQFTRDKYDELKTTKARKDKIDAQNIQAKADSGKGFHPARGSKGTWSMIDWNRMIGTLSDARRKEIEKMIQDDIASETSDPVKRAEERAFVKMLFSKTNDVVSANKDRFKKMNADKRKLNALKKKLEDELEKMQARVDELQKKKDDLNARLKNNPDDDEADSELVDVEYDLEEAWRDYNDKLDDIQDIANNADYHLSQMKDEPEDDLADDSIDTGTMDKRKLATLSGNDIAPMMNVTPQAYMQFERATIDMILKALGQTTGLEDKNALLNQVHEMPEKDWNRFIDLLGQFSDKRRRDKILKSGDTTDDLHGILKMYDRAISDATNGDYQPKPPRKQNVPSKQENPKPASKKPKYKALF